MKKIKVLNENDKLFTTEQAVNKLNEDIDNKIFKIHMPNKVDYSVKLIK